LDEKVNDIIIQLKAMDRRDYKVEMRLDKLEYRIDVVEEKIKP
jgi:hypothetical protein